MVLNTEVAYGVFWIAYVIGFVLLFLSFGRLVRFMPTYGLRTLLKAALVVLLLTPVQSMEMADWWIPAWLYGGYEMVLGNAEQAARALSNLTLAGGGMLIVWVLDLVRYRLRNPSSGDRSIFSSRSS